MAIEAFSLKILSTDKLLLEEAEVDFMRLPGKKAEIGICPNHSHLVSSLQKGVIYIQQDNLQKRFFHLKL